ncbi:glycosyltransferase [Thiomicrorhabdus sp. 6S2-11]|uniref:Glycosyltransferase n=1 Tax=Thiomicrorhabdus marina TaxID=2818442 RepID=A0ABS3Q221_9GAMM|nr:glycosyltransferase [Thiomicrorhabdus marina]MBO1926346.1 glycosyltransferase [Thiomicrorhabdus marina]
MNLKVMFISYSFYKGGAGIAAGKFKNLLNSKFKVMSVSQDEVRKISFQFVKRLIGYMVFKFTFYDVNPIKHSLNFFSYSPVIRKLQQNDVIFNVHWVNNDTLSVFDINKIPCGTVLTLHDEWFYLGSEHYARLNDDRYYLGYNFFRMGEFGVNWNYLIWKIKMSQVAGLKDRIIVTVPSNWMRERASKSLILNGFDIRLLPNPINTDLFYPIKNELELREYFGLEPNDFVLVFGAIDGSKNKIKGGAVLEESLRVLKEIIPKHFRKIKIVTFGEQAAYVDKDYFFEKISLGHISSPEELNRVYNIADCVLVPSIVEAFGQVAAEAQASGKLVVCFNTSGLKDIVVDDVTGFLVEPYDASQFANKILEVMLMEKDRVSEVEKEARDRIIEKFSLEAVRIQYESIIDDAFRLRD